MIGSITIIATIRYGDMDGQIPGISIIAGNQFGIHLSIIRGPILGTVGDIIIIGIIGAISIICGVNITTIIITIMDIDHH